MLNIFDILDKDFRAYCGQNVRPCTKCIFCYSVILCPPQKGHKLKFCLKLELHHIFHILQLKAVLVQRIWLLLVSFLVKLIKTVRGPKNAAKLAVVVLYVLSLVSLKHLPSHW